MISKSALKDIANILRRDSLISTTEAGSGHPSSCLSCAELLSCVFFSQMSYDLKNPDNPDNDEFILSKGHAAPILYSALIRLGCLNADIKSLRKLNSPLEGHPLPSIKCIKAATGSLGQGLSVAAGIALAGKLQKKTFKVYVLLGDSELAEGSNYEAFNFASQYKLNNLIAIADINRLGQRGETMFGHHLEEYEKRFSALGWKTIKIDGHDIDKILDALKKAESSSLPTIILAKTYKGKGVSFIENKEGWHGRSLTKEELDKALKEIPNPKMPKFAIKLPVKKEYSEPTFNVQLTMPEYKIGQEVSTREAYGKALAELALVNKKVIAIDSEVSNSTSSEQVKKITPKQFIEAFIAEQNMISVSLGLSKRGYSVFASTFAAFLSRAYDQIRMSSISSANMTICGSHAGSSIGQDGASQMGLEDISFFRTLPNSIIFYPSDANATSKILELSSKLEGIKYIRTTRSKLPVIYEEKEKFQIGEFKVPRHSLKDKIILVGAGITLHESIKAHESLKKLGINSAVVDIFCLKPFNAQRFIDFVKSHGSKIIITEDHYKAGGIGEMILSYLPGTNIKAKQLYVSTLPHSAKPEEVLEQQKINAKSIEQAALSLVNER